MREQKKRSVNKQVGKDAVHLRVHRRSMEQKSKRANAFCMGRQGLSDSNLDPVLEEEPHEIDQRPPPVDKARDVRKEQLKRWKEEKKLKSMLGSANHGKPFKVTKVNHSQAVFLFSENQVNGLPITAGAANAMNSSMRVTRSKANALNHPKTQPVKNLPAARTLKTTKPQLVPAGPPRKVPRKVNGAAKSAVAKSQPVKTAAQQPMPVDAEVVRVKREPSFAPLRFNFTAPAGVSPLFLPSSCTIDVEKLLPPLKITSSISPVETCSKVPAVHGSTCNEHESSVSEAEKKPIFKTPHAVAAKEQAFKISPLLENNPHICMTRGRPPSSKKSTPRRSRISGAVMTPATIRFDIQQSECGDSPSRPVNPTVVVAERAESNNEVVSCESSGVTLTTSYFRKLLEDHTRELRSLCEIWQNIMKTEHEHLNENVNGKIRTTVGQSELLIAERFKQFSGLVEDCELGRGEKTITCFDLQGFWEMIYFQVEDVKDKFNHLEKIKASNWENIATPLKKPAAAVKRVVRKHPKPETRPKSSTAAQAAKQRLAEAKAKAAQLRKASANCLPEDQISVAGENLKDATQLRVQDHVPDEDVQNVEIVSSKRTNGTPKRRRSQRCSVEAVKILPTADENKSEALLLPVPVLEALSLNSPVARRSSSRRLSELYSPLSAVHKTSGRALETIIDDEDTAMAVVEANVSAVSPRKRITRSSNLMRFSEAFINPADLTTTEKENAVN